MRKIWYTQDGKEMEENMERPGLRREKRMKVSNINVTWKSREHSRPNSEVLRTELKHLQDRDSHPNLYEPLTPADRQRMIYLSATLQSLGVTV